MQEILVILTLMSPHVKPLEQRIPTRDCEASKTRIEAAWAATPTEGFFGVITCEEKEKKQ